MPELPEVETITRHLTKLLKNKTITDVFVYYDKIIEYGDYTTAIYQIQNNDKQWSELPIK